MVRYAFLAALFLTAPVNGTPALTVLGNEQPFWIHKRDRCDEQHIPDAPLRAIRRKDGQVVVYETDNKNRPLVGPTLLAVRTSCSIGFEGAESSDPKSMDFRSWITSVWTNDGMTVHGLTHGEYRALQFPGACRFKTPTECWYNVVTYVVSHDGGLHFEKPRQPRVVAAPAFTQDVDQGRHRGFFVPSNVIDLGNFYYALIYTTGGREQKSGNCLFRLDKKDEPWNWKAYDGKGFDIHYQNPYVDPSKNAPCAPVGRFPNAAYGIARYKDFFIATFDQPGQIGYKVSRDLITWTETSVLLKVPTPGSKDCGDKARYAYPALIDPQSSSINFDTVGAKPLLFLIRWNMSDCKVTRDRDVVYVPISVTDH